MHWGATTTRFCQKCGEPFEARLREIKIGRGRYCSLNCYHKDRKKKSEIICTCQYCGEPFETELKRLNEGGGKFCSVTCSRKGRIRAPYKGERIPYMTNAGYMAVSFSNHPLTMINGTKKKRRFVLHHWLVMYEDNPQLALFAKRNKWTIHHKNGKRDDNRLENLQYRVPGNHPQGVGLKEMVKTLRNAGYMVIEP